MTVSPDQLLILLGSIAAVLCVLYIISVVMLIRRGRALTLAEEKLSVAEQNIADTRQQYAALEQEHTDHQKTALMKEREAQQRAQDALMSLRESEARSSEQLKYHQQLKQEIVQSQEKLQKDFEALSSKVFEESRKKFESESKRTLDNTLDPLKREIEGFRRRVDETHRADLQDRNKLHGQIAELHKQTQQIGQDAVQLASALKGESKSQGNWGEMVLERLLEDSGLEKGREYEVQASYRDEDGNLKQPDVIIHLPENKDIVIDSKVSLKAYEAYFNAESEVQQAAAMKAHLQSLRVHFTDLSGKSYENLGKVNSLDFVFMFIPIEPAYHLALQEDPSLFQQAYDKGVVLVSPTTLMVTLKTVANIWRYEKQNRNAQEIADSAGGLYDQFALLIESLDDLGKKIDSTQRSYDLARKRLSGDGRGNLVRRIETLKKLGAKSKKQLPDSAKNLLADKE